MTDGPLQGPAHIPVADGLMQIENGTTRLIGSRCTDCETLYFPTVPSCRNPVCAGKRIADTLLPNTGTLISYTVQRYHPPPLFRMDNWAPFAIGLVDLGYGLEVMGMLGRIPLDEISIGMAVQVISEALYHDDAGQAVVTYKFAPIGAGSLA